jgi:GxxExxY protein
VNLRAFSWPNPGGFAAYRQVDWAVQSAALANKLGVMNTTSINQLCDIVRETSYAIHCYHRHGHLEKIYETALANRLRNTGLQVDQQHPLSVFDEDGTLLGDYHADLFVAGRLIVELKAVRCIADEHVAQLLGYLRSSRIETGLLINFGAPILYIKKYLLTDQRA